MAHHKIKLDYLIFELTDACNHACKFCYNYWKGDDDAGYQESNPSYNQVKKTLKTVFRQADVGSVSFSGGEPMLVPRIHDLIFYTRRHKSNVSVLTNGTLPDEQDIESFTDLGVRHIQIPILSADEETHDALTQRKGSWKKAIQTAKRVMAGNPDLLTSVLVLTRRNLDGLGSTLQLYRELGVRNILVNRFNIGGSGRKYKAELELSHPELRDAFAEIDRFAATHTIRFFSGVCTPICVLDPMDYKNIRFSFCNREVSQRPITVNYRGDVRFCNHSPRILGNIFENSLRDILYHEAWGEYFDTVPGYCRECALLNRCGGGCRAASEQVYGSFAKEDPLLHVR